MARLAMPTTTTCPSFSSTMHGKTRYESLKPQAQGGCLGETPAIFLTGIPANKRPDDGDM